jgi:hypothetical protein
MKYLRKFNEDFDDEMSIKDWCEKLGIDNATINEDDSIDVNGNVHISYKELEEIPIKFNIIYGGFECDNNELTSLFNSPSKARYYFCNNNYLTSLEYCSEVIYSLDCSNNELESLIGATKILKEDFYCADNKLTTLVGGPIEVGGEYSCMDNSLYSLEGCPKKIVGFFDCSGNYINEVYNLFPDYNSFIESLDYNYLRGDKIVRKRLEIALINAKSNEALPESLAYYNYI